MRLIDANKLFNWGDCKLSDAVKYGNKDADQQYWSYSTVMMYEVADEIEDAPTVLEWIKCSERLPEPCVPVIARWRDDIIQIGELYISSYGKWYRPGATAGWMGDVEVTHWMPMPPDPDGVCDKE